ncbi:MAG: tRNA pseudouridine(55) synthase TruB [Candidatus Marinimicrobia bacterium]|nr:tRNA pseudouridine(55) synthase TruB [Candidatus Neomarinimicrobiota bacterium]MCF7839723.1 tRNA pseudouridine(55) synthase TruB [Candidatus Neomarinimicrobiota bacterium]
MELKLTADNIFTIDKPVSWTSFDVVNKIRNITRIKKVGHAGTLDPFATGVLVVLTGIFTKRQSEFMALEKVYRATVKLGEQTDTGDLTGQVVKTMEVPEINESILTTVAGRFMGEIDQVPPMYSAKKQNGKKLYELARAGKVIPREPRRVHVYDISIEAIDLPEFTMRIRCGKGTYIRTLAEDMGDSLNTCATLHALRRLAIGPYKIEDAESIVAFEERWTSCAA